MLQKDFAIKNIAPCRSCIIKINTILTENIGDFDTVVIIL